MLTTDQKKQHIVDSTVKLDPQVDVDALRKDLDRCNAAELNEMLFVFETTDKMIERLDHLNKTGR